MQRRFQEKHRVYSVFLFCSHSIKSSPSNVWPWICMLWISTVSQILFALSVFFAIRMELMHSSLMMKSIIQTQWLPSLRIILQFSIKHIDARNGCINNAYDILWVFTVVCSCLFFRLDFVQPNNQFLFAENPTSRVYRNFS